MYYLHKAILISFVNSEEEKNKNKKKLFEEFEIFLKENTKNKEEVLKEAKLQEEKFKIWKSAKL